MAIAQTVANTARAIVGRLFRQEEDARVRGLADMLEQVPLFRPLPRGMLVKLAGAFHERTYRKDEYLYYEGDPGIGLYIVKSGAVKLLVEDDQGQQNQIREIGPEGVIGTTCLLGGGIIKRTESAQAATPTEVLGLFSPELRVLQRRHPKTGAAVAVLLARHFAQRLTETRRLLREHQGASEAAELLEEACCQAEAHADPPPGW